MRLRVWTLVVCAVGCLPDPDVETDEQERGVVRVGNGALTSLAGAWAPDGRSYALVNGLLESNGFRWATGTFDPTGWRFDTPAIEATFYDRVVSPWALCHSELAKDGAATKVYVSGCFLAKVNDTGEMDINLLSNSLPGTRWKGPSGGADDFAVRGNISIYPIEVQAASYFQRAATPGNGLMERLIGRQSVSFQDCGTYGGTGPLYADNPNVFVNDMVTKMVCGGVAHGDAFTVLANKTVAHP